MLSVCCLWMALQVGFVGGWGLSLFCLCGQMVWACFEEIMVWAGLRGDLGLVYCGIAIWI